MTKKTGLTFEQHLALGRRLRGMTEEVTKLIVLLGRAYPIKNYEPYALKVLGGLCRLRSNLEDDMFREHPDRANLKVYYGPPDDLVVSAWIDAAERQPPDGWPRPCVVIGLFGDGWWAIRRWENGAWWAQGQLRDERVNDVLYWLEVYPLPDGTTPPEWAATAEEEDD